MKSVYAEIQLYSPAVALDALVSRKMRRRITCFLGILLTLLGSTILGFIVYEKLSSLTFNFLHVVSVLKPLVGVFCILILPFWFFLALSSFYNTLYFRGLKSIFNETMTDKEGITEEVAAVCLKDSSDLTKSFLTSSYGKEILLRSGILNMQQELFLNSPRVIIDSLTLTLKPNGFVTLQDVGEFLLHHDAGFKEFLFKNGISEELFKGANEWVSRVRTLHKNKRRWWSRDNLGKISGIGRELSYGVAYALQKYVRNISTTSVISVLVNESAYANEIITKIETILARDKSANVILVGETGVGKMDMLIEIGVRIREGSSVNTLLAKRIVVLDTDVFIANHNSKEKFEPAFFRLLQDTEDAGNIILVIQNLTSFIAGVKSLGVNISELLSRFLLSSNIQIIGTVDPSNYHQSLENDRQLLQHFEPVIIEKLDIMSTIRVLEELTWSHERRHSILFTYPSVVRIAVSAEQYLVEGVMPDKAITLLSEVASIAVEKRIIFVTSSFIDECVTRKTGIPIGPVSQSEREMLVHLEEVLHERVIGQTDAIRAIASAMRRARVGIESRDKPIGSFLFLGSTGVGKTETAKALAHVFFGNEDKMIRFDMSEYSSEDALARLIGDSDKAGALPSALHVYPYSVLLLDELEKASHFVHDLFLQILDEGTFTDARGTKINARNTIIIATSNAGSDILRSHIDEKKHHSNAKDEIINSIIAHQVFKPEFINRFDAVVLFETLGLVQQKKIALLMLKELQDRLRVKGYELVIDDILLNVLIEKGYDPDFGARPMRRAIQDLIEEKIALKIIEGGLQQGDTIHFGASDFV